MKKKLFLSIVGVFTAASLFAAQLTVVLPALSRSNIVTGPLVLNQVTLAAGSTSNTTFLMYDAPSTITTYSNQAYSSITTYATNVVNTYTNYFGLVNSLTNVGLVSVTNTTAAATNSLPIIAGLSALAATTVNVDNMNTFVSQGILVTNTLATGTATITINFSK